MRHPIEPRPRKPSRRLSGRRPVVQSAIAPRPTGGRKIAAAPPAAAGTSTPIGPPPSVPTTSGSPSIGQRAAHPSIGPREVWLWSIHRPARGPSSVSVRPSPAVVHPSVMDCREDPGSPYMYLSSVSARSGCSPSIGQREARPRSARGPGSPSIGQREARPRSARGPAIFGGSPSSAPREAPPCPSLVEKRRAHRSEPERMAELHSEKGSVKEEDINIAQDLLR